MAVDRYDFGGLVFSVTHNFSKLERNFCKVAGLYQGQPRILTILKEHAGATLSELSLLCGIGMSSLSVSVHNLEKAGLLRKEGLGKSQKLYLTDAGNTKAQTFHLEIDTFYRQLFEHLDASGAEQLYGDFSAFDRFLRAYNQTFEAAHGWR